LAEGPRLGAVFATPSTKTPGWASATLDDRYGNLIQLTSQPPELADAGFGHSGLKGLAVFT
jgi:hypothetical protein